MDRRRPIQAARATVVEEPSAVGGTRSGPLAPSGRVRSGPSRPSRGALPTACSCTKQRRTALPRLQSGPLFAIVRGPMANRAIWSMRKRHEWLTTPLKKKRIKRATRVRCGLQDAMDRKAAAQQSE